ncbi:acetyltransferase [Microbacterium sp. AZCO]|uniref:acetyltransferase n=1 Tax=Microbacterium sp. AZCO TaxID=3142976 RepID=UPI0031F3CAAB
MTRGVLLLGASGLAREVIAADPSGIVGIADDDETLHGRAMGGVPILGGIADISRRPHDLLVCVGGGSGRRAIVRRLLAWGLPPTRFATFVAPTVRVGRSSSIGAGSILLDGVVVTADASIGRHVVMMPHCTITHDDVIADYATLAAGVSLGGGVHIGQAAYLGMNASVRQHITVGAEATVGMGAAVVGDIPEGQIWAGVPAQPLDEVVRR